MAGDLTGVLTGMVITSEVKVSQFLSADNNWKSVFVAFLNAHNRGLVLEVCPLDHAIAFKTQWWV
jgi:hypothetical protein